MDFNDVLEKLNKIYKKRQAQKPAFILLWLSQHYPL